MRKPEQRLWDSMRAVLGKKLALQRIENVAGTGMPDVVALGSHGGTMTKRRKRARTTFVELKAQEQPPIRGSTPMLGAKKGLSVAQRNWHLDWARRGGLSLVVIGVGYGQKRRLYAVPGALGDKINSMTGAQIALHAQGWAAIGELLGAKR